MGKAGFMHIAQNGGRLQLYIKKDAVPESDYQLFGLLDLGDIMGAEGYLFRTRTGELSVHVEKLEFLSKTLLAHAGKWHGLEDVETRYRQRYLDLIANPGVRDVFVTRAKIISSIRRQLEERGFIEVETPMMQPVYGGAAARPFITHHNTLDIDLYLRIAPELYLKRLIVGGLERVYEINRNFRNEGISTRHNPEFTMVEFYQAYTDYRGMMDLTEAMLRQMAIDATGGTVVKYGDIELDFGEVRRLTMREAVLEYWEGEGQPSDERTSRAVRWRTCSNSTPRRNSFSRPSSTNFPVEVSPLANNNPDDPRMVDRFELFIAGMEIGNAYTELNNPIEQCRRFDGQLAMRETWRRRSASDGRGLSARHVVRDAANRRRRPGHRPAGDAADEFAIDPRRDSVPAAAARRRDRHGGETAGLVNWNFEWFVAGRYLRARRKEKVISVITVISIAGVAAGVMALVISLAVNNGFRNTLQRNLLAATAAR